jgi:hypothetical protein
MSMRIRLFFMFALLAAVIASATPHMASAAGGPLLKTGTYKTYAKCDNSGDENICQTHADAPFYMLYSEGYHFTAHGKVRVRVSRISTGEVLDDNVITAKANGSWGLRYSNVEVCSAGYKVRVEAVDLKTHRQSNTVIVIAC